MLLLLLLFYNIVIKRVSRFPSVHRRSGLPGGRTRKPKRHRDGSGGDDGEGGTGDTSSNDGSSDGSNH